jgi:hypothetical protein
MINSKENQVGFWFLSGVFLICMSCLMLQVVQTRVISVILWYHLAFLAISMAMLGMTVGALIVHFRSDWFPTDRLMGSLAWISAAFSAAVTLSSFSLITTIVPESTASTLLTTLFAWLKLILILVPPYVFGGMAISLALTRSRWPIRFVYGVDLIGAASGCLLVLLALQWADGVSVLIGIGASGAAAAACFAWARRLEGFDGPAVLPLAGLTTPRSMAALTIVLGLFAVGNALVQPNGLVLMLSKGQLEFEKPAALRWNTFSRVKVGLATEGDPHMWGPSPIIPRYETSQRSLNVDGSAGTTMYRFSGALSDVDFLRYDITNLAYAIRTHGRAAVIGVGGGRDILSAYLFGFRDVTGVELNPIFVNLLQDRFRDYNRVAALPGVRLFADEGRSWFARTSERFDLIEMSLVDTWAATGVGAYTLSENGLYHGGGLAEFSECTHAHRGIHRVALVQS